MLCVVYDITPPVGEALPVWPGDPPPRQRWLHREATGAGGDLSEWRLSSHTGAHVDAPSHFIDGGLQLDEVPLARLVGACRVLDLTEAPADIVAHDLPAELPERLLLKTRNSLRDWSREPFRTDYVGLQADTAECLIERGVRLVGADYLSLEPFASVQAGAPIHRRLLQASMVILEGLVLADVPPGDYLLVALPLRLQGSEAAPARVILL